MQLTPAQAKIVESRKRFRVVNCGRRFGKTTLAVLEMIACAVHKDDARIAYIAPTFIQARDIAWEALKAHLGAIKCEINESRLEITLPTVNGKTSKIFLKGWESVESLRGQAFDFLVIDEVAMMRKFWEGWEAVLRPALTDRKGQVLFISTPRGFNHFYELFSTEDDNYEAFHFTTYDNPHIPKEEIDEAKNTMNPVRFEQEYLAEFRKMEGLIWNFPDSQVINIEDPVFSKLLGYPDRVIAGIDFGFDHPTALVVCKIKDGSYYIVDEWRESKRTSKEVLDKAKEFQSKYNVSIWYPDPANPQLIEDLKREGLSCGLTNKNVVLGLSKVGSLIRENRLFIASRCQQLLGEMDNYVWKEDVVKEQPVKENDDLCDALRYVIMGWSVNEPEPIRVSSTMERLQKRWQEKMPSQNKKKNQFV